MLRGVVPPERIASSADLANIFFAGRSRQAIEAGVLGFLLNVEDQSAFSPETVCKIVDATRGNRHRWLVQEVRTLSGSEWELLARLPLGYRSQIEVRAPDYSGASLGELANCWGAPEILVTSRYHGALFGAWSGARVVVIERNLKLIALVEQFGLASGKDLRTADPLLAAIRESGVVEASRLDALAASVRKSGRELAAALASR